MNCSKVEHRWEGSIAKPEARIRTPSVVRNSDLNANVLTAPNTSFQRTLTRGGCGPLNSDR